MNTSTLTVDQACELPNHLQGAVAAVAWLHQPAVDRHVVAQAIKELCWGLEDLTTREIAGYKEVSWERTSLARAMTAAIYTLTLPRGWDTADVRASINWLSHAIDRF